MTRRSSLPRRVTHVVAGTVVGALTLFGPVKHAAAGLRHGHAANDPRCNSVAHVGDSLSDAARHDLVRDYRMRGWRDVRVDAAGGRGIMTYMFDPVTGLDAVRRIQRSGFDGCWVMALGTNDTANTDSVVADPAAQHAWRTGLIRAMMDELGGAPVMWVNTHLVSPDFSYSTADAAAWNAALREVQPDYPNMLVFDWDQVAAAHPEWTSADLVHDTPEGSYQRAEFVTMAATLMLRDFVPPEHGHTWWDHLRTWGHRVVH